VTGTAFTAAGISITWVGVAAIAATLQLLAFAMWSGFSKSKFAKTGLRTCDLALLISGVLFLGVWAVAFDARAFIREAMAPSNVAEASVAGTSSAKGSCASLQNGMRKAQIRQKVGEPDEIIREDDVRGPGAEVWVYKDRCAAHMFEGTLEFVE
jgi:hypothetical protein